MYLTFKRDELLTSECMLEFLKVEPPAQAIMIYQRLYKTLSITNNELYHFNSTTKKYTKINYNIQDYLAMISRKLILDSSVHAVSLLHDLNYYRNFVHDLYFMMCTEEEDEPEVEYETEPEEEDEDDDEDEVIVPKPKPKLKILTDEEKRAWVECKKKPKLLTKEEITIPKFFK
jgi:hypothetical protein